LQTVHLSLEESSEPKGSAGLTDTIATYIKQHQEICRLGAMLFSVLEQNPQRRTTAQL
jgi:hypothetical protein